jgi:hypothetical protein
MSTEANAVASAPQTISGRLVYLRDNGQEWGRERFSMTRHAGGRTYRAVTEFDDRKVLRDTNWSLSNDWLPQEGFGREIVDGVKQAHSWYRVAGAVVECEAYTLQLGRVSQTLVAPTPVRHLGLHSILADVLVAAARGFTDAGIERAVCCVTNSTADYGIGGYLACAVAPLVTYVGSESLRVRAGAFAAERFLVRWSDQVPKYSSFWVTRDHCLPLRLIGASGPVSYELCQLESGSGTLP